MTSDTTGGAGWELGQAAERMAAALASGDTDAIKRAMSDHAAALGSQATSAMAGIAASLLAGQERVIARLDTKDAADITHRARLQDHIDARFDAFGVELDEVRALRSEVSAALSTFQVEIVEIKHRLDTKRAEIDDLKRRVEALEQARHGDGR